VLTLSSVHRVLGRYELRNPVVKTILLLGEHVEIVVGGFGIVFAPVVAAIMILIYIPLLAVVHGLDIKLGVLLLTWVVNRSSREHLALSVESGRDERLHVPRWRELTFALSASVSARLGACFGGRSRHVLLWFLEPLPLI